MKKKEELQSKLTTEVLAKDIEEMTKMLHDGTFDACESSEKADALDNAELIVLMRNELNRLYLSVQAVKAHNPELAEGKFYDIEPCTLCDFNQLADELSEMLTAEGRTPEPRIWA